MLARPDWRRVDLVSDLHLSLQTPDTVNYWLNHLARTDADALFILGDFFELWVGDDLLDESLPGADARFAREMVAALREAAAHRPIYVMHGNRDFLLEAGFHAASGTFAVADPCVLAWGNTRWLLSHGDAWCLEDRPYMAFREQVRQPAWQQDFLARPLAERLVVARQIRSTSEARKATAGGTEAYADVDRSVALRWLEDTHCSQLVHGHTHRPGRHDLGPNHTRWVLSDWDAAAQPPRAEVLSLHPDGTLQRYAITP